MDTITKVKTHAVCRIPLVGCLLKASEYKSISEDWQPVNKEQEDFKRHLGVSSQIKALTDEEFDSTASDKEEEINQWLSDHGFTLKCPSILPGGFATASVVKLWVKWLQEAEKSKGRANDGNTYDYASFTKLPGKKVTVNGTQWGMSQIATKEDNTQVFVAMPLQMEEMGDEALLTLARELQMGYYDATQAYDGLELPMINMDFQIVQGWVVGMNSDGWRIDACIQQFILKLNEKGATAKSAAVMTKSRSMSMDFKPRLFLDKPFLIWFSRDGITYPAFLGVCGYDCWAAPADLS
jgi:hypothetical protein